MVQGVFFDLSTRLFRRVYELYQISSPEKKTSLNGTSCHEKQSPHQGELVTRIGGTAIAAGGV
jgi:hypothetical protein